MACSAPVKSSEPPIEHLRSVSGQEIEPREAARQEKFVPRYVEVPQRRAHGTGNLVGGLVACLLAIALFTAGILLSGPRAILPMVSCLLTFLVLWVLFRLRHFRQKHGTFAAIGLIALLGAVIPLLEYGFVTLAAANRSAGSESARSAGANADGQSLMEAFGISTPDTTSGEFVKVLEDSRVMVAKRPYLIRAGDVFPLEERSGTETTFVAKDLRISLPSTAVEVFGTKKMATGKVALANPVKSDPVQKEAQSATETPAQISKLAQQEAIQKYPALGVKNSPENESFLRAHLQLKDSGSVLLSDPKWPLELADILAKREGWGAETTPEQETAGEMERDSSSEADAGSLPNEVVSGSNGEEPSDLPADPEPRDDLER